MEDLAKARARYLERLHRDLAIGRVDGDIAGWLVEVNRKQCLVTTSSCSGRVALIYGPSLTSKKGARILGSWHDPRECRREICRPRDTGLYTWWLSLQPPIIHFLADSVETAEAILECGDRAGFSKLGYRAHRTGLIHVEAGAGDKLHLILPAPCMEALSLCTMLGEYKRRLARFMECMLGAPCTRGG